MKNYLRHNFRRHCRTGRSRISVLDSQPQDIQCSSVFLPPLQRIISGYIPDKYQRSRSVIKKDDVKEKNNTGWLDNFLWNSNSAIKLKREFLPFKDSCHALKKYFSACNFFDKNDKSFNKENYKSAEYIFPRDSNCENPLKQIRLSTNINSTVPSTTKCTYPAPYLEYNRSRSYSNPYLRNFLRPSYEISDNGSRSFTTLRAQKSESTKPIIPEPLNVPRNLNRGDNVGLLMDSGQVATKAPERNSGYTYGKIKKRDFDWLNSFSSEAVILQPSRGEFSIKKLINKTNFQERLWGLPSTQSFAKTFGPGINDNLVQYTTLKHKMQSEFKKNNSIGESMESNEEVRKLIQSAKEKNRQNEHKKAKPLSSKLSAKNVFRTIKDSINLKPIDILKNKESTAENNEEKDFKKVTKKRSILNFRLPNFKLKEKQKNVLQNDNPINKPSETEYESSASYRHVFQDLFNKANKTKIPSKSAVALSFFNRQQGSRNLYRPITKLAFDNPIRKEKELKKQDDSSTVIQRNRTVNLKNQARTPFQKPSDTQITSKSKASFSTVSKIPKANSLSRRKLLNKNKVKSSKRYINTERLGNKPVIKRTLYSTLGYYPVLPGQVGMKSKKYHKNTKSTSVRPKKKETKEENKSHTKTAKSSSGYVNQRRSMSSFGAVAGNITETDTFVKTITKPDEPAFKEVMTLCKEQSKTEKKPSVKKHKLKRYDRCSVQEKKKPERRRGFVCRIATMLNLGCGRRRRANTGCQECGKKAG